MTSVTIETAQPPALRLALASLSLAMLLSSLGISIANVALPTLTQAFGASFLATQWIVLAYLLAMTALVVGAGRLGDVFGHRRLLIAGLAIYTAASVACGLAPSLPVLIAARGVQGTGAAILMALAMALVGEIVPRERTGSAMGLLGTMSAVGTALGPSLGGLLIATAGWRAIFLINVPLGIAALLLAWRALPTGRREPEAAHAPLLDPSLLRDAALRTGLIANALVSAVVIATLVVGPFYLARALGLDPATVGLVMSAGPLVAALTGVPAGRIVDRFGASPMILAGLTAMIAGCAALAAVPTASGIPGYVGPLVVMTAGYGLFQAANNTRVMANAPQDQRGVISGALNLSRNLGLIAGTAAMGAIFALGSAATDIATANPADVATGMRVTFAVAAALIAAAIMIAASSQRSERTS